MITDREADAELSILCLRSEQAGAVKTRPPAPPGYTLEGYLTAIDAIFHVGPIRLGAERVFYGWLLSTDSELICVGRGTVDAIEWWLDGQFLPVKRPHLPTGGLVEDGFSSIYDTLELETVDGESLGPAAKAIAETCSCITITGHSLGAAWSTYLAADCGALGTKVKARLFASPRPGDALYGEYAARLIDDCASYRFTPDVVPDVPAGLGYELLPGTIVLPDDPRVKRSLVAFHHVTSGYAPQLNPAIPIDPAYLAP